MARALVILQFRLRDIESVMGLPSLLVAQRKVLS